MSFPSLEVSSWSANHVFVPPIHGETLGENLVLLDNTGDDGVVAVSSLGASPRSLRTSACRCVAMLVCLIGRCVDVEAAASRWFLHVRVAAPDCCAAVTQCGGVAAQQSVSGGFVLQGWRGCRLEGRGVRVETSVATLMMFE